MIYGKNSNISTGFMIRESFIYRLLQRIGLIKTHEVSKKEMCENAKLVCNKNCERCAWRE